MICLGQEEHIKQVLNIQQSSIDKAEQEKRDLQTEIESLKAKIAQIQVRASFVYLID